MNKRLLTEMTDEELMKLERLLVRSEAALRQTKPMTDFREYFEEMHSQLQEDYGDNVHIFEAGFKEGARWVQLDHSVFKHHGITDADV